MPDPVTDSTPATAASIVCPRCGHEPRVHACWETRGVVTCKTCPPPKRRRRGWDPYYKVCPISIRKMDALAVEAEARNGT